MKTIKDYKMPKKFGLLIIGGLVLLMSVDTDALAQYGPGGWQLPADYYVPAKMDMTVTHPRPEASSWAYSKNAYPGIKWEIPIVIQGGAWPFRYEIVDNDGATGLEIGEELERSSENGFIVHRATEEYGVLWWENPMEGEYEILVRVHDQDNNSIDVPISLTVGTEGWIFVDADNGDDENDGSINAPFETIDKIHDGGSAFSEQRVYLSGVVPMDGNHTNGNLTINDGAGFPAPKVWVGLPGSDTVLEAYEGRISLTAPDFYMANLEHRHHEDYYQDEGNYIHMITAWANTDRLVLHDVYFSRFQGNPVNTSIGNSSIIMFTDQGTSRNHVAVVNNIISGNSGPFTSAYQLHYSVFEKNRAVEANFIIAEGSVSAVFYMKRTNEYITLRANEFWDNNTWGTPGNLSGAMGLDQSRNIEFAYNTIETPGGVWDSDAHRRGAMKLFVLASNPSYFWTEDTPVWLYRNSLKRRIKYEGENLNNMPDENVITERNVLDTGIWPTHDFLLNIENLDDATYFDSQMLLTGSSRTDFLGKFGAEIAVQEGGPVIQPAASFTFDPNEDIEIGMEIHFTDASTDGDGTVTGWNWDFGDGTTSTNQNPVHTYNQAGEYIVSLVATDNDGNDSPSYSEPVTVLPEFDIAECGSSESDWIFCDDFEEDRLDQYFDFFSDWGRFKRHSRGIMGSNAMSSYYGHYSADPAGESYDIGMKLAFGKTPDDSAFLPAGDPEIAEREINWRFFVTSRTDDEDANNSTGPLANVFAYGPEINEEYVPFMKVEISYPDQSGELESKLYTGEFNGSGQPTGTELAYTLRGDTPVMLPSSSNTKWHKIEIYVKLNDPGESNGEFELRIDDEVENSQTGLNWVGDYTDYGINAIEIRNTVNQSNAVTGNDDVNRTFDNMLLTAVPSDLEDPAVELNGEPGYRMLSAPVEVALADLLAPLWTQGMTGADHEGGEANVWIWDNTATGEDPADWQEVTDLSATVAAGTGVLVYVFDEDEYGDPGSAGFPKHLSVSGPVNSLPVSPAMNTNPGGFTLLGNPVNTGIDWDDFTRTGVDNVVYVWDPNKGSSGDWVFWDGAAGDLTDGVIHPFQGFFVRTSDGAVSPLLSMTTTTTPEDFYGKDPVEDPAVVRLHLEGEAGLESTAWLRFSGQGSLAPNRDDAVKLRSLSADYAVLGLASPAEETPMLLGLMHLPEDLDRPLEIPLAATATQSGSFILRATQMNLPEGWALTLSDTHNGQKLRVEEGMAYTFDLESKFKSEEATVNSPGERGDIALSPRGIQLSDRPEGSEGSETRFTLLITPAGAVGSGPDLPAQIALEQNYPNPFNPTTQISYQLPEASQVRLEVYDMMGRRVATLVDEQVAAGAHQVTFDAGSLSSGTYLYRLQTADAIFTKKLTLIK